MKPNVGGWDRVFRFSFGVVIILLGLGYHSWWGALGLIPLLTGAFGWCPVYLPFGTSTHEDRAHSKV